LEQSIELLNAVEGAYKERDYAIITLFLNCGLRVSEMAGLNYTDIRSDNTVRILGKGNKERVCFLTSRAKMELKLYLQQREDDCEYVFVREWAPHTQLSKTGLGAVIKDIGDRAGMKVHPHMLRHYFADCAHGANIDVLDISRMMGHASISKTQIYIASNTEDLAYKHARIG
jgi:site-specific recombinase XerD